MITEEEAKEILKTNLGERQKRFFPNSPEDICIIEERTIRKSYGWYFFYDFCKYLETGDIMHKARGNVPAVVLKTGELFFVCIKNGKIDFAATEAEIGVTV